jgi:hypothetical protein
MLRMRHARHLAHVLAPVHLLLANCLWRPTPGSPWDAQQLPGSGCGCPTGTLQQPRHKLRGTSTSRSMSCC